MKKLFICFLFFFPCGCATIFSSTAFEMSSTLLTLGNVGQTLISMTAAEGGGISVGPLPPHYSADHVRMIREAWEQQFQLAKKVSWEAEEVPWKELVGATVRKGDGSFLFALVEKRTLRTDSRREEITVYRTVSGRTLRDPSQSPGEAFYPHIQASNASVPVYLYTAWFFTRSRQPSGILAGYPAENSPCRKAGIHGAGIVAVSKNSPAQKAGLQSGDTVSAVNGQAAEYATLFALLRPGKNSITFCRNGSAETLEMRLPAPLTR